MADKKSRPGRSGKAIFKDSLPLGPGVPDTPVGVTPDTPREGMSGDEGPTNASRGDEVSEARVETTHPIPAAFLKQLESAIPHLAERVARRVQAEVPAYAGSTSGRRRRLIALAVTESAAVFVRRLGGRRISTAGVDDLFRKMGYGEASEGNELHALERALRIAAREAWQALQDPVIASGLPASALGRLGNELTDFVDHLAAQAAAGHTMAMRVRDRDVGANRSRLIDALVGGADTAELDALAEKAGWPLPRSTVVVTATALGEVTWPDHDLLEGRVLTRSTEDGAVFIASPEHTGDLLAALRGLGQVRLAQSWVVDRCDVADALRWTRRALELAEAGAIPRQPLIDCARFRTQLWLHAEPALRRELAQDLLKPLFAETPNSREILSATLLVWLETRESAPAIAAILGVHPQTVRYRWRRINELFGDALRDPEFIVQLTMVLKASVPLWVAGDQSDFERFLNEETQ